jgi:hypothetical protein
MSAAAKPTADPAVIPAHAPTSRAHLTPTSRNHACGARRWRRRPAAREEDVLRVVLVVRVGGGVILGEGVMHRRVDICAREDDGGGSHAQRWVG